MTAPAGGPRQRPGPQRDPAATGASHAGSATRPPASAWYAPRVRLDGSRLVLRDLRPDDLAALQAVAGHPEVSRFQPWWRDPEGATRAYLEAVLRAAAREPRTDYTLAAELRAMGAFLGYASLVVRSAADRAGELGYFLHPDYWGRGYATEAAGLLLGLAFGPLGLHRVAATCDPRNATSARVLRKLGMTHEGRLREAMLIRDGWRDSDVYGLLEHEWRPAPR